MKKELKVCSLFSGCGGLDLGFELAKHSKLKFKTIWANDIHKICSQTHKKNFPNSKFICEDIWDYDLEKIPNCDIILGGFPCQDFSMLRGNEKRKGVKTRRGNLYIKFVEAVKLKKPIMFIAENVKGLMNILNVKEIIQHDFACANGNGYIVLPPQVLHAAHYGVPQSRERVFFIGIKKSELRENILKEFEKEMVNIELSPYPEPSHSLSHSKIGFLLETVKLKDIFKDIVEPELSSDPSQMFYSKAKFMGRHCQGQREINPESISPTIRAEHHGNIEYRRLSIQNGGKIKNELSMGLPERRLTPRECALIQTFPPDYDFVIPQSGRKFFVSPSSAYKLIGNAVPPLFAKQIGKTIIKNHYDRK